MAENSNIEWCHHTFNPWRGCTKVSAGCAHCYAETNSHRNPKLFGEWGPGKPRSLASEAMWKEPLRWNDRACRQRIKNGQVHTYTGFWQPGGDPANLEYNTQLPDGTYAKMKPAEWDTLPPHRPRVFCASLADWLDDEAPIEWFKRLLELIHKTPHLDWLLLTKRIENWRTRLEATDHDVIFDTADFVASEWLAGRPPTNIWLGTSVENQAAADTRIPELLKIPARIRFLSCEPLLGPVDISWSFPQTDPILLATMLTKPQEGINWVIVGGESGPHARPMRPAWAESLQLQCEDTDTPFLFKQWGNWFPRSQWQDNPDLVLPDDCDAYVESEKNHIFPGGEVTYNVGKKAAGRLLNGIEYNGYPVTS